MSTSPIESTVKFGVAARLVAILGQHLIRDNTVGLMELIKNGYDADADHVTVEMYSLAETDRTTIIVQDNGDGMTRETITGPWLTVAHGHKEATKGRQGRSLRGRIPLGEKGVGRFAVHKLGRRLTLVTRPTGYATELVLQIDWDDFESSQDSIESVGLQLTERNPVVFGEPGAHGTRLEMVGAREKWQRKDVAKLQASLMRLTHPRFGVSDFQVRLRCPEFRDLEDLTNFDITEKYMFRLECRVDETGVTTYEYRWRDRDLRENLDKGVTVLWNDRLQPPVCGPLIIQLCAWLGRQRTVQELGTSLEQIRILSGVSIYRDGFRILPYGDEGDDWLGLDKRRINNPSQRFGNRQVIGTVGVDQIRNMALMDKTNREGLQENQAYHDLKALVLSAVSLLENLSAGQRHEQHKTVMERKATLNEEVNRLDNAVRSITTPQLQSNMEPHVSAGNEGPTEAYGESGQVILSLEQMKEIVETAQAVKASASAIVDMQEEERDAYLQLVGAGLAAERFVHEMDRQIALAMDACEALRSVGLTGRPGNAAKFLDLFVNSLRGELRTMGQLRYVRRSQRAREVSVREITEFLLLAHDREFSELDIEVDPWMDDDFTVFMSEAAVAQVVGNILDNAISWLGTVQPEGGRRLRIDLDAGARTLTISNNGPDVDPLVRDRLFIKPFVTTKENGHGLGMYLSAEIMKRAGGSIALVSGDNRVLEGAGLIVRFPQP
ncbi:MAG TPA: sensor histidine kinase [Symbiobacteriaceae bacterium]|nr:sensor histidine kinase [Symbiobacteriaceae bacterium]